MTIATPCPDKLRFKDMPPFTPAIVDGTVHAVLRRRRNNWTLS
jgi:hypothetical protein